jgi:hypothetical protein
MLQHHSMIPKALAGVALTALPERLQRIFERTLSRRRDALADRGPVND